MIVDHETKHIFESKIVETGKVSRVSSFRQTADGLMSRTEQDIAEGKFTPERRAQLLAALGALLDYEESCARSRATAPRPCAGGTEAEPCKGPAVMRAGDRWYCVAHDPNGGR